MKICKYKKKAQELETGQNFRSVFQYPHTNNVVSPTTTTWAQLGAPCTIKFTVLLQGALPLNELNIKSLASPKILP